MLNRKEVRLFILLGGFFITNALVAEFIGVKIFSLFQTLGLGKITWSMLGVDNLSFDLSVGILLWPVVFVMTDVINEYYGKKGVRMLSFLAVGMILYAFLMIFASIQLPPADFWPTSHIGDSLTPAEQDAIRQKTGDYNYAFGLVFGQGLWIIVGSIIAFLVGQLVDVHVFHKIKSITGEKKVWLRATGSTLVSQFIDSFVVLFIAFYIGAGWEFVRIIVVGLIGYSYKFLVAILLTPVIYLAHDVIDRYLGKELSDQMKDRAHQYY